MSKESFNRAIELVNEMINNNKGIVPLFYTISGSHIYGFDDEQSDIDVRGFHIDNERSWDLLNNPKEQFQINEGNTITDGYNKWSNIELKSYELKKFGKLLFKGNPNVNEWIFSNNKFNIIDNIKVSKLRDLIREQLPLNIHRHYLGMATSNYKKYVAQKKYNQLTSREQAKKFLYVIRGLLGAINIMTRKNIEPNIIKLSKEVLHDTAVIKRLIDHKRNNKKINDHTIQSSMDIMKHCWLMIDDIPVSWSLNTMFTESNWPQGTRDDDKYMNIIDNWMKEVRDNVKRE